MCNASSQPPIFRIAPLTALSLFLSLCLLAGCAKSLEPISLRTAVSESGKAPAAGTVAVPLLVVVKHRTDGRLVTWPDPALTDRLAALLLDQGYTLLDRSRVKSILSERGLAAADIEREDDLEALGKALDADVLVLSRLVLVESKDGRMFEKKLTLRGVRMRDGQVLFSVSSVDVTPFRHLTPEDLIDAGLEALRSTASTPSAGGGTAATASASATVQVEK